MIRGVLGNVSCPACGAKKLERYNIPKELQRIINNTLEYLGW